MQGKKYLSRLVLYLILCVCVCSCVYATRLCEGISCMHEEERTTSDVILRELSTSSTLFWRESLLLV